MGTSWIPTLTDAVSPLCMVSVVDGVSSVTCMAKDLERDCLEKGTIIVDANRLLLFDYRLDPSLDLYIYHVCSIGTRRTWHQNASRDNKINKLTRFLLKYYEESHSAYLCTAGKRSSHACAPIGSLPRLMRKVTFDSTLFIPGIIPRRYDAEFARSLCDS